MAKQKATQRYITEFKKKREEVTSPAIIIITFIIIIIIVIIIINSKFHLDSLSAVHSYDLYHIHSMPFSSYNRYKLNSHLTCFRQGFIAQLVEHRTGIVEVTGLNPIGASQFFLDFIHIDCLIL